MRQIIVLITLIAAVAIAGCVGQFPGLPGFGSDVIKPSLTTSIAGVADIVTVENVQTLPSSPFFTDQVMRLTMNVVSKETDVLRTISNVYVSLYDASVLKDKEGGEFCNAKVGGCAPEPPLPPYILRASETKAITFMLKAPSASEIAGIITTAMLNWLVKYDYSSTTSYDILTVSESEITRLQQQGQTLSVPLQNIQSAGPIKVDVSLGSAFTTPLQNAYITVKLRNIGSGFQTGNKISAGKLTVDFSNVPLDQIVSVPDNFAEKCDNLICTNTKDIEMFKKESVPLLFVIRTKLNEGTPHHTSTITASVNYTYELRGSTTVEIRPPPVR